MRALAASFAYMLTTVAAFLALWHGVIVLGGMPDPQMTAWYLVILAANIGYWGGRTRRSERRA